MKLYLKDDVILPGMHLTPGIPYNVERTPVMYDPNTYLILQPVDTFFIVTCDDGKTRKVPSEWFISQEDLRELKLNELGI